MPHHKVNGRWVRKAYDPSDYEIPARELAALRRSDRDALWELDQHDGLYANYERITEVVRDGVRWIVLRNLGLSWIIEVELSTRVPQNIRVVPPEVAWACSRRIDVRSNPPIEHEGEPPPPADCPYGL